MRTKALVLAAAFLCLTLSVFAQDAPSNIYAAGVSFNNAASPAIAGTALYAHSLNDSGTYAFTVFDALPANTKPFTVTANVSAGVAQKVFTLHGIPIFAPTAAGVSFTGQNTGWAWSTGALADIPIKKQHFLAGARFLKSSVGGGGYQPIVSVLYRF